MREGEKTSDLALQAARKALSNAAMDAGELDLIVCATTTPDETFPGDRDDASGAAGHDPRRGVRRAGGLLRLHLRPGRRRQFHQGRAGEDRAAGRRRDDEPRLLDWNDRTTCVLFGDGAGAVVLQAAEGKGDNSDRGVLNTKLYSDGRLHDLLYVDGGPSSTRTTGHLRMQGKEVFRHAVTNISAAIVASVQEAGVTVSDIDWFVPHQANQRILDGTARKLGIAREGGLDRRPARQYLGGLGAAGAGDGGRGRPDQAGRPGAAGGHGRRLHLGRQPHPLVNPPLLTASLSL